MIRILAPLAAVALWLLPCVAAADAAAPVPVIEPGNEALVGKMLEPAGGKLPGRYKLVGARIEKDHIVAAYAAGKKELQIALRHPSLATSSDAVAKTERFVVELQKPAKASKAVRKALAALEKQIRATEREFKWGEARPKSGSTASSPKAPPPADDEVALALRNAEDAWRRRDPNADALFGALVKLVEADRAKESMQPVWAGKIALAMGKAKLAAALFERGLAQTKTERGGRPGEAHLVAAEAAALAGLGRDKEATAAFEALWKAKPEAAKACHSLEPVYFFMAKDAHAAGEALLRAEMAKGCDDEDAWVALSVLLAERGADKAEEEAIAAGRKAHPTSLRLLDREASLLFRTGRVSEARIRYTELWEKDSRFPGLLAPLGASYVMVDDDRQPNMKALRARLAKNPKDGVAQYLLGMLLFYTEQYEAAIPPLQKAIDLRGDAGRMFVYMAMSHQRLGRSKEARGFIERAIEVDPYDPDVYYCRSLIVRATDLPMAITDLERYLAVSEGKGKYQHPGKTEKVRDTIERMKNGEVPPDPHSRFSVGGK